MAYIARVSSPANQKNQSFSKLLKYCLDNGHYSVFEQASMTIEIETHLAIATQILRHRSFVFQQFSQRYSDVGVLSETIPQFELRVQDTKNRQSSHSTLDPQIDEEFQARISQMFADIQLLYQDMLNAGIAKESARFVLPNATLTKLYITGNIRSWIFYLTERLKPGVQKEHRQVAELCQTIFIEQLPEISNALEWSN